MKIKFYFFILASIMFACPLQAETLLTWEKCLALTVANNPELKTAEARLKGFQYSQIGSKSNFFPQLSAELGKHRNGETEISQSASLQLSQNIFSGFQDHNKLEQASAQVREAQASLQLLKSKLSFELKTAYQSLIYSQDNISLADDIVRRRKGNLGMVSLRFEGGRENKGSVLLSQAYYQQAEWELVQAKNAHALAALQLKILLGLAPSEDIKLSGVIPSPEEMLRPDFYALAFITPEHAQAKAQEDLAKTSMSLQKSTFYPSLNLAWNLEKDITSSTPSQAQSTVHLSIKIPIFSGLKDYYGLRSSQEQYLAAAYHREHVASVGQSKLLQSYNQCVEAKAKLKVDFSFMDAAQVRSDVARNKYNIGLLTFEDWDQVENDYISRQKNYLQSQKNLVLSLANWEQTQGVGAIP